MTGRESYVDTGALLQELIQVIAAALARISETIHNLNINPDATSEEFDHMQRLSADQTRKELIALDHAQEAAAKDRLRRKFSHGVQILGEESLRSFSEWHKEPVCVLLDMVDGTDLVEMGIDLWCCAALIYDRVHQTILSSVVGLPSGDIYYAEHERDGFAFMRAADGQTYKVFGVSSVETLEDARIAFYGQKTKNLSSVCANRMFLERVDRMASNAKFRIYNFAGNPMMVRLCDRVRTSSGKIVAGGIDAVFDVLGQHLHDAMPGAFIAKKAGAYLCDFDGNEITYDRAGELMSNPNNLIQYVLAATKPLGTQLAAALRG